MSSCRNPSLFYTQQQVDWLADRILEGKYCKIKINPEEVYRAGFCGPEADTLGYIRSRFSLTSAGTTMRTNKFNKALSKIAYDVNLDSPRAVWKVASSYYCENPVFHVGPGGPSNVALLRESAWLLWGWMWTANKPELKSMNLRVELVGFGGVKEYQFRTNKMLASVQSRLVKRRTEATNAIKALEREEAQVEMISGMVQSMVAESLDRMMAGE
jgi:hypothetical protein